MNTTLTTQGKEGKVIAQEGSEQVGELNFLLDNGVVVITHTRAFDGHEGKGVAKMLVNATIDYARENGLKLRPICSYAYTYMMRHPNMLPFWTKERARG
ncbi:GNAT family N-acetyltransferase [Prevotella corporis]|uniref:GNAT family N-acetyltransferase n=1 Tax=Prevotella corporis TaxID=28128 RepID=UPI0004708CFA|nr:GNAT family N-acetyltransferase [Prevotella corporis]